MFGNNTFMNRGMAPMGYSMLRSALQRQQQGGMGGGAGQPNPMGGLLASLGGDGRGGGPMQGGLMGMLAKMFQPGMGGAGGAFGGGGGLPGSPLSLAPPPPPGTVGQPGPPAPNMPPQITGDPPMRPPGVPGGPNVSGGPVAPMLTGPQQRAAWMGELLHGYPGGPGNAPGSFFMENGKANREKMNLWGEINNSIANAQSG